MICTPITHPTNLPPLTPDVAINKFRQTVTTSNYHNSTPVGKLVTAMDYFLAHMECDFSNRRLKPVRLGNFHNMPKPTAIGALLVDCRKLLGDNERIHTVTHSEQDVTGPVSTDESIKAFNTQWRNVLVYFYANKRANAYGILITLLLIDDYVYYTVKTVVNDKIITL